MNVKIVFLVIIMLFLALAPAVYAAPETNCLSCHPGKSKGKSKHPVGCSVCHIGVDASRVPHKIIGAAKGLPSEGSKLCMNCHAKVQSIAGVHMPLAVEMCTGCHSPHASKLDKLLLSHDVCFTCHAKAGKKHVHPPVAGGMCTDCHNFHRGKGKRLLKTGMPNLCYGCHRKETLNGPVTHAPIALGMCVSCHEPHQSDLPKLKKADAPGMCLGCHEEPKGSIHSAENRKACLKCHNPHASSNRYLL